MTDDDRPISIVSVTSLSGPLALEALRRLAEDALTAPVGEEVERDGTHRVSFLPHDVAAELVERIDAGQTAHELSVWLVPRLNGAT